MNNQESIIINNIIALSGNNEDYWAFRSRAKRDYCHGLMTYPAMMVPEMQGELIDILLSSVPTIRSIYDPFVGSGTVMGESMLRGIDFVGTDVNPLAILCCEAKSDQFDQDVMEATVAAVEELLAEDDLHFDLVEFKGVDKWFDRVSLVALSKIKHSIQAQKTEWCRRFLWVALTDIVRKYSNTRLSTYKLHIESEKKVFKEGDIFKSFIEKCRKNIVLKSRLWRELSSKNLLDNNYCSSGSKLVVKDVRQLSQDFKVDLVVTSPPYGDNMTTVTYGQYSFLPLNFINLNDIKANFDRSLINSQSSIDSASLGGSLRDWEAKLEIVRHCSASLNNCVALLQGSEGRGEKRLASFAYDLYVSLQKISSVLSDRGFVMFTLGNRRICKLEIPLQYIVKEFLESLGMREVFLFERNIPSKRMPGTMSVEHILIMRKL